MLHSTVPGHQCHPHCHQGSRRKRRDSLQRHPPTWLLPPFLCTANKADKVCQSHQDCWPHFDVSESCWVLYQHSFPTWRHFVSWVSNQTCSVPESHRFFDKHILLPNLLPSPCTRKNPVWPVKKDTNILLCSKSLLSVAGPGVSHRLFSLQRTEFLAERMLIPYVKGIPSSSVSPVRMTCLDIAEPVRIVQFVLKVGLSLQCC